MNAQNHQTRQSVFAERLGSGMSLPHVPRSTDCVTTAVLFSLGILAVLAAVRIVMHLLYPFPIDTGEGSLLDAAWRVAEGRSIYALLENPPYFFIIYNPILPYLAGFVVWIFGPSHAAVRLVAVAFYAGAAFVIYLFVRRETASRTAGVVAALFFVVERHTYSRAGYLVTDWPGIFFSVLGLYLWRGSRRHLALVAFALAFFSKQTSLMAAAAAFSSLFLEGRRGESVRLLVLFLMTVAAGLAISALFFGRPYFVDTLRYASIAPLELHRSFSHVGVTVAIYFAPVIGWFALARKALRDRSLLLLVAYAVFGGLLAFMSGKVGASRSYLFDFAAALSIIVGYAWAYVESRLMAGKFTFPLAAIVILQVFLMAVGTTCGLSPFGDRTRNDFLHDAEIAEAIEDGHGVIFTREAGFGFGAKAEPLTDDSYKIMQMIEAGEFSPEILLAPIRERVFPMVIMPANEKPWKFFSDELRQAVFDNYVLKREAYGELFLVPREEGGGANGAITAP
jgi:hypothetical protein